MVLLLGARTSYPLQNIFRFFILMSAVKFEQPLYKVLEVSQPLAAGYVSQGGQARPPKRRIWVQSDAAACVAQLYSYLVCEAHQVITE